VNRLETAMPSSLSPSPGIAASPTGSLLRRIGALLMLCALAVPAWADPPARVGRLAETEGQVWVYDAEANEWITAARNRPVTTGDRLSTEGDGRAEVRIGSTTLRIGAGTELEVVRLDDERLSLHLHNGSLAARLRTREAAGEFELVTAEGRFRTDRPGNYRFDREDDTSRASVVNGQVQFQSPDSGVFVNPGQQGEFWRDGGTQYSLGEPRRDDFSDWVAGRDQREDRSVSARYVSAEMTGVEDLDRYGRWEQTTEYGALWTPREIAPGWAPYRSGHWSWVNPWGWTWVDDAPWGFAPFHYGRWVLHRNTWGWAPGQYVARPVFAPALVAWVGGPAVSVTVGRRGPPPTVGWFPLAPREVYVPGHRFSPGYLRGVNMPHVSNITNIHTIIRSPGAAVERHHYRYRDLPQAMTRVPVSVIERRQPVGPAIVRASGPLIRQGGHAEPVRVMPPVSHGGRPPGARGNDRPGPVGAIPPAPGSIRAGGRHDGRDPGGQPPRGRDGFPVPAQPVPGRFDPPPVARPAPQPVVPGFGQQQPQQQPRDGDGIRWRQPQPQQQQPQQQPQQPGGFGRGERGNPGFGGAPQPAPRPVFPAPVQPALVQPPPVAQPAPIRPPVVQQAPVPQAPSFQSPAQPPQQQQPQPRREFGDGQRRDFPGRGDDQPGRHARPPDASSPQQPRPEFRRDGGGFGQAPRPVQPQAPQPSFPQPQQPQPQQPRFQPPPQPQQPPQAVRPQAPQPQPPAAPGFRRDNGPPPGGGQRQQPGGQGRDPNDNQPRHRQVN
jgi:hypothetical protein